MQSDLHEFPLPLPQLNPHRILVDGDSYERDSTVGLISILDAKSDFVAVELSKPDGHLLHSITADGCSRIWSARSGRESRCFRSETTCGTANSDFSIIFTGSKNGDVASWCVSSGKKLRDYKGHTGRVTGVCVSTESVVGPHGFCSKLILAGSADGTARIWAVEDSVCVSVLADHSGPIFASIFSPDSTAIATASSDTSVIIWRVESKKESVRLRGHGDAVTHLQFSKIKKNIIFSASSDRTVRKWERETGECLQIFRGHGSAVSSLALVTAGEKEIVVSGSRGEAIFHNSTDGTILTKISSPLPLTSVAISPIFFIGSLSVVTTTKNSASLWHVTLEYSLHSSAPPGAINIRALSGHRGPISGAVFSDDGGRVAIYGESVRIWDIHSVEASSPEINIT